MITVIQRVTSASVNVAGQQIASIGPGLLALLGVEAGDDRQTAERLVGRICRYRVFADETGRMNRSLTETGGALLLVPQFTLTADTDKGLRPGFSASAPPEVGRALFDAAGEFARGQVGDVQTGRFGADMQVALVNDGPVTFRLRIAPSAT